MMGRAMKVVLVTPELPPGPTGGIGTLTDLLARGLDAAGFATTVLVVGSAGAPRDAGSYRVEHIAPSHPRKLGWFAVRRALSRRIAELVAEGSCDVVEAPDWCGLTAGVRPSVPLVIRCNGSTTYFGAILGEPVRRQVYLAERMALRGAASVAAVSRFTAEETQRLFRLRSTPRVIPNSFDLSSFAPRPLPEEPNFLYLGTVVRKKGVIDLAAAFSSVVASHPHARLTVVGRDAADKVTGNSSTWSLCESAMSSDALERVRYVGPVQPGEVAGFVASARACALPSYAEASPLAWLEAMASGRAIVGYDLPWAREVVTHRGNGLLVPAGDVEALAGAMTRLIEEPQLAQELGERAGESVKEGFDPAGLVEATVAWYRSAGAEG